MTVYPTYEWNQFKFKQVLPGFWNNSKNIKDVLDVVGKKLGVNELNDWYNVSYQQGKNITL